MKEIGVGYIRGLTPATEIESPWRKVSPSVTLSTTNPTGTNQVLHSRERTVYALPNNTVNSHHL